MPGVCLPCAFAVAITLACFPNVVALKPRLHVYVQDFIAGRDQAQSLLKLVRKSNTPNQAVDRALAAAVDLVIPRVDLRASASHTGPDIAGSWPYWRLFAVAIHQTDIGTLSKAAAKELATGTHIDGVSAVAYAVPVAHLQTSVASGAYLQYLQKLDPMGKIWWQGR